MKWQALPLLDLDQRSLRVDARLGKNPMGLCGDREVIATVIYVLTAQDQVRCRMIPKMWLRPRFVQPLSVIQKKTTRIGKPSLD